MLLHAKAEIVLAARLPEYPLDQGDSRRALRTTQRPDLRPGEALPWPGPARHRTGQRLFSERDRRPGQGGAVTCRLAQAAAAQQLAYRPAGA
jgi:hypothetical protein